MYAGAFFTRASKNQCFGAQKKEENFLHFCPKKQVNSLELRDWSIILLCVNEKSSVHAPRHKQTTSALFTNEKTPIRPSPFGKACHRLHQFHRGTTFFFKFFPKKKKKPPPPPPETQNTPPGAPKTVRSSQQPQKSAGWLEPVSGGASRERETHCAPLI